MNKKLKISIIVQLIYYLMIIASMVCLGVNAIFFSYVGALRLFFYIGTTLFIFTYFNPTGIVCCFVNMHYYIDLREQNKISPKLKVWVIVGFIVTIASYFIMPVVLVITTGGV